MNNLASHPYSFYHIKVDSMKNGSQIFMFLDRYKNKNICSLVNLIHIQTQIEESSG